MNPQKIKIITGAVPETVANEVNEFCRTHSVFATQTHVTPDEGAFKFTAYLFYREVQ